MRLLEWYPLVTMGRLHQHHDGHVGKRDRNGTRSVLALPAHTLAAPFQKGS